MPFTVGERVRVVGVFHQGASGVICEIDLVSPRGVGGLSIQVKFSQDKRKVWFRPRELERIVELDRLPMSEEPGG